MVWYPMAREWYINVYAVADVSQRIHHTRPPHTVGLEFNDLIDVKAYNLLSRVFRPCGRIREPSDAG